MKTTITINFNNTCSCKPSTSIEKVNESRNTSTSVITDPLTFAELMLQGRTWCPAIFKEGKRKNDNWLGQSVFALDFDSGVSPDEVIEKCKEYKLIPNVVYTSFSDSVTLRKFRVVFFLNAEIRVAEKAKELQLTLMELFPDVDISCKDYARMFFGGKQIEYFDDELNDIFEVARLVLNRRDRLKQEEPKKDVQGSGQEQAPSQRVVDGVKGATTKKINKKNFNFDLAIERVKILNDFANGKWLYHAQLFGLATNLKYINGGLDWMREMMEESGNPYGWDKFKLIEDVAKSSYKSQRLNSFSPYKESYDNIFAACKV